MDQAIASGLLVNELISNALKHGFPQECAGDINVELQPEVTPSRWRLRVKDNGVGLPEDFEARRKTSLGLQLVDDLRVHRAMLLSLGADWHRSYEFDAHFATVNQFRIFVTRWAAQAAPPTQSVPSAREFDVAAWRLLGAGAMLLDEYEQSKSAVKTPPAMAPVEPVSRTWWQRLRGWWVRQAAPRKEQRKAGRRGRRQTD